MKQYLVALLVLGISSSQYVQALQAHEQGIFDKMVVKLTEKDRMAAEFEVVHAQNLAKAEKQAAMISSGQVDQNLVGNPTIDDELSAGIDKLSQVPLKQLAGENNDSKQKKQNKQMAQSLVQAKIEGKELQAAAEQDDDRDDFEGFGSITAMAQHKDVLVERKLEDGAFKAQLESEEKAKQAAQKLEEENKKKDADAKAQAEKDEKAQQMKETLAETKAKMQAVLNKSQPKKAEDKKAIVIKAKSQAKALVEMTTPVPVAAPVAAPISAPVISQSVAQETSQEQVSGEAYQRAISSIEAEDKKQKKAAAASIVLPASSDSPVEDGEETGFLGKHSKKLAYKQKLAQAQEAVLGTTDPDAIDVPLSAEAPKHKGMLARAMEKDIRAQHEQEIKEKDQLMAEALADPVFKNQMDSLKTQTALQKNASYL